MSIVPEHLSDGANTMEVRIVQINQEAETKKWREDVEKLYTTSKFVESTGHFYHIYYGAYMGLKMVGHSILLNTNIWVLDGLFVKKNMRGKGIGKQLVHARVQHAKELGVQELWFCTADSNKASLKCHSIYKFDKIRKATKEEAPEPSHWYKLDMHKVT